MHKSHFMSQLRLAIPLTLEHEERPVDLHPTNYRELALDENAAKFRYVSMRRQPHGPFDPWILRNDFLGWPGDGWENFVFMAGLFNRKQLFLSKNDFMEWQALLREALLLPPKDWQKLESRFHRHKVRQLAEPLPITFDWESEPALARIRLHSSLETIIATIQLDKLRGARFRICARHDCVAPPFDYENRQNKIYCSSDCAHKVAVRNSRAKAKEKERKVTHGKRTVRRSV